jgi:hypothetical protein
VLLWLLRYLERSLSPQERNRFYFFSSFFFTKLLGSNSASTDINECEVDYNQVRKWTGEVNLFEKDYIFIPILRRCLETAQICDFRMLFNDYGFQHLFKCNFMCRWWQSEHCTCPMYVEKRCCYKLSCLWLHLIEWQCALEPDHHMPSQYRYEFSLWPLEQSGTDQIVRPFTVRRKRGWFAGRGTTQEAKDRGRLVTAIIFIHSFKVIHQ